jgi:hypothetical protein
LWAITAMPVGMITFCRLVQPSLSREALKAFF